MTILWDWLQSGWISAIAVAILWAETLLISLMSAAPAARFKALAANSASGTCLLVAVGLALAGGSLAIIALLMAGSLLAHGLDMAIRLRRPD